MKICIAGGDSLLTKTLKDFLTEIGCEVVFVKSASELPASLRKEPKPPGLALINLNESKKTAGLFIEKVHKQFPRLPLILLTDDRAPFRAKEAISLGIYGYLHKPFSLEELELMINQIIKKGKNEIHMSSL